MSTFLLVCISLLFSVTPSLCLSANQPAEKVTIQLKWLHQFQFAGYYAAIEQGFYAEEGLDVELRQRVMGTSQVEDVLQGRAQYGTADVGLLNSRLQGKPVVLLAQIFQHSPLVLLTRKDSGIRTARGLAGRLVQFDTQGVSDMPLIALILKEFGTLDAVEIQPFTFDYDELVSGKVAAMAAYITSQPFSLGEQGLDVNIIDPRSYGIDFYGDNLFTSEQELRDHPQRVEKIRRATIKGWQYALKNRHKIIDLILARYNPQGLSRAFLEYEARETEKLIVPELLEIGSLDVQRFQKISKVYQEAGGGEPAELDEVFFYRTPGDALEISSEERAYLDSIKLQRIPVYGWMPFNFKNNNGDVIGIAEDYWVLIREKLGIREVKLEPQLFARILQMMQQGQTDLIPGTTRTRDRESYAVFSDSYEQYPIGIAARKETGFISHTADLEGHVVAVGRNYTAYRLLKKHYPGIIFLLVANTEEALERVVSGDAYAAVDILPVLQYKIERFSSAKTRLIGVTDVIFPLQVMVRKEYAELIPLINRAIAAISHEERANLRHNWIVRKIITAPDYSLMWLVVLGFLLILSMILVYVIVIQKQKVALTESEVRLKKARNDADDANQAKSIFLANMSHELRTPLNAILGFSRILAQSQQIPPEQQEKLNIINHCGEHLLGMINDVLDLSRIEAGRVELDQKTFDLRLMLNGISKMFEEYSRLNALSFDMETSLDKVKFIQSDEVKLRQILINLLGNALKFTRKGGILLRVSTYPVETGLSRISLQIEVIDSGMGISQDKLGSIFDPFTQPGESTSEQNGSGLGLSITRSLVKLMGGEISVESEIGKGSHWHVDLPVSVAQKTEVDSINNGELKILKLQPGQPEFRILVVEDNAINRLLLTSLLSEAGFVVKEVHNGEEAVSLYQQWNPQFIWMDLQMPVMDGFEATRLIRTLPGGDAVKIFAQTAGAFQESLQDILQSGCDGVVYKPFQSQQIFEAMEQQLGVRFVYSETENKESVDMTTEPICASLKLLPAELTDKLRQAVVLLDVQQVSSNIQLVRLMDEELADFLQSAADSYRFGYILKLLKENVETDESSTSESGRVISKSKIEDTSKQ